MTAAPAQAALREGNALLAGGRVPEAVHAFRQALGHDARFAPAHYNLGIALRRAGDWRGAVLAFRAAARLEPRDFDAMQNLVRTLGEAVAAGARPFEVPRVRATAAASTAVSVVVCSIDEARLSRMRASFAAALAGREHEFVVIRDARSLAEAYTRAIEHCRHEVVVFSHDDVELGAGRPLHALVDALAHADIAGVAGSRRVQGPAVNWAGHPHLHGWVAYPAGDDLWDATVYSLEAGTVGGMQALDGLLFATRREVVRRVGFDAQAFDGFHFYDLDFTYRAFSRGLRLALTTGLDVFHASAGDFGPEWHRHALRFRAKFPELAAAAGPHHSYGARLASREQVAAFYDALRALAQTP